VLDEHGHVHIFYITDFFKIKITPTKKV
jgi:hypothetical protein